MAIIELLKKHVDDAVSQSFSEAKGTLSARVTLSRACRLPEPATPSRPDRIVVLLVMQPMQDR